MPEAVLSKAKIELSDIRKGDVFSESSHYVFDGMDGTQLVFKHTESGTEGIRLSPDYVRDFLSTADQFTEEIKVGKLDKKWTALQIGKLSARDKKAYGNPEVGDIRLPGIRTVWDSIHSAKVFTVCFQKADKALSKTAYNKALKAQQDYVVEVIEKARRDKKSMRTAASKAVIHVQENPVLDYTPGDDRTLRGYKVQFESIDGRYQCMDMDINEARPVNINTIKWLVIDGIKYIVE